MWSLPSPVLLAGSPVNSVAFSPAGNLLAVGSQTLQLWNPATRAQIAAVPPPGGTFVNAVAFAPSGRVLAAGYGNGMVQLRRPDGTASGPPARASATGLVEYVAFSPSGDLAATGGDDGTVWLWNLAVPGHPSRLATLNGPNGHVYSVTFSPGSGVVAAGSADGTVRLWDTRPAAAAAAVCANAGQPLTRLEWANYVPGRPYRAPCP